ncbi:hypothetical protein, partial [Salmonella enterica]|uniref:hypothetical protein n=1 Tax=Salmonella enterica TaxID=28901 RepID=UPI0015F8F267
PNTITEWSLTSTSISADGKPTNYLYPNARHQYIEFKPTKLATKYYCVYAIYSAGDSFGNDESAYLEVLEVFTSYSEALDFANDVKTASDYDFNYKDKEYHIPWIGYFESLDDVLITEGYLN